MALPINPADSAPSLLPVTDDSNPSNASSDRDVSEQDIYPSLWNNFMTVPFDQVELTRLQSLEDFLHGGPSESTPTRDPTPETFSSPLNSDLPSDDSQNLDPSLTVDPGSFLFSSPGSGSQEAATHSSRPADFSLSQSSQNRDLVPTPTLSRSSLGVELPPQPSGQPEPITQLEASSQVYSPPTGRFHSSLPAYGLVGDTPLPAQTSAQGLMQPYSFPGPAFHSLSLPAYGGANNTLPLRPFSFVPAAPFSPNSLVELPVLPVVPLVQAPLLEAPPPPPPGSSSVSTENFPWNDYTDGGRVSNSLTLPLMSTHIAHINQPWSFVFVHTWHAVFHDTHVTHPPSNLVQYCNAALKNAYIRWEQRNADEPLLSAPITIDGIAMTAIRNYTAPPHIKKLLQTFERQFTSVLRFARQGCMNHLMRCTITALVACHVVPFLPPPHVDIHPPPQLTNITIIPRVYSRAQKEYYEAMVRWDDRFGCEIWHKVDGNGIVQWFGNEAVRSFLAALLSPNEYAPYTLGVRRARRGPKNVVTSWGPVTELDNRSVLSLIAKCLASLSTSILGDVVQKPRPLPFDQSEGSRNSGVNALTGRTFKLLLALDDPEVIYPHLQMHEREEGHSQLTSLKEYLGFAT